MRYLPHRAYEEIHIGIIELSISNFKLKRNWLGVSNKGSGDREYFVKENYFSFDKKEVYFYSPKTL